MSPDAEMMPAGNPLLRELQQGRKMRSLEVLLEKLEEDQRRHHVHAAAVRQGLSTVEVAQMSPSLVTAAIHAGIPIERPSTVSLPTRRSYPEAVRAEVLAARGEGHAEAHSLSQLRRFNTMDGTSHIHRSCAERHGRNRIDAPYPDTANASPPPQPEGILPPAGPCANPASSCRSRALRKQAAPQLDDSEGVQHGPRGCINIDQRMSGQYCPSQSSTSLAVSTDLNQETFHMRVEHVDCCSTGATPISQTSQRQSRMSVFFGDSPKTPHLRGCAKKETIHLKHDDDVLSLAFSSDGNCLVAGGEDSTLIVWRLDRNERLMEFSMESAISAVAFSRTGQHVVAGTMDSSVSSLHVPSARVMGQHAVEGQVLCVTIGSVSGELLAVGTTAKQVTLMTVPKLDVLAILWHEGHVRSLSFSSDGSMLAGGGGTDDMHGLMTRKPDGHAMQTVIWRLSGLAADITCIESIPCDDIVHAVKFSPCGRLLAVGSENKVLAIMVVVENFATGSEFVCPAGVRCIAWSPDSQYLASGGEDMQITVWDVCAEELAFQLPKVTDWYCALAFSPNGSWLASCGFSNTDVTLHPVHLSKPEETPAKTQDHHTAYENDDIQDQGKHSDHNLPASPRRNSDMCLYDTTRMPRPCSLIGEKQSLDHEDEVMNVAFSPDGKILIAGGEDLSLVLWDTNTQSRIVTLKTENAINVVAYSNSGQFVAAGTAESAVHVWSAETHAYLGDATFDSNVLSITFGSATKEILAVGTAAKRVLVLSIPEMEEIADLHHDGHVHSMSFSPDGRFLAVGGGTDDTHGLMTKKLESNGMKTVIWKVATLGTDFAHLGSIPSQDIVHAVSFSPCGKLLAAGGEDCVISLLWVGGKIERAGEMPCAAGIRCLSWSSDSCFLVSGGEDCQITIWNVSTANVVLQLPKRSDWYSSVAFSTTGNWVAACGFGSSMVEMYQIETSNLVSQNKDDNRRMMYDSACHGMSTCGEKESVPGLPPPALSPPGDQEIMKSVGTVKLSQQPPRTSAHGQVYPSEHDGHLMLHASPEIVVQMFSPSDTDEQMEPLTEQTTACGDQCTDGEQAAVFVGHEDHDTVQIAEAHAIALKVDLPPTPTVTIEPYKHEERKSLRSPVDAHVLKSCGTLKLSGPSQGASSETVLPKSENVTSNCISVVHLGQSEQGFMFKIDAASGTAAEKQNLACKIAQRKSVASTTLGIDLMPYQIRQRETAEVLRLSHHDEVMDLSFSPDGAYLIAGGEDAIVAVWDVATQTRTKAAEMEGAITAVAYSPSAAYAAAGDVQSNVTVWHASSLEEVGSAAVEGEVMNIALSGLPHELLAVGSTSKAVVIFSIPDMVEIANLTHGGDVHSVAFSPDGCMLAGGGGTDNMHGLMTRKATSHGMKTIVWRVSSTRDCSCLGSVLFEDIVHAVAFSPSGKTLAAGGENCAISLLHVDQDFKKVLDLPCSAGVRCLAWSPDSRFLASGGEDMQLTVWNVINESIAYQLPKCNDWLCAASFCPDSSWLATCGFCSTCVTLHPIEICGVKEEDQAQSQEVHKENSDFDEGPPCKLTTNPLVHMQVQTPCPHHHASGFLTTPADLGAMHSAGTVKLQKPQDAQYVQIQVHAPISRT